MPEAGPSPMSPPVTILADDDALRGRVMPTWRRWLAGAMLAVLALWPAWTLYDMQAYLRRSQLPAAQAASQWASHQRRFDGLRALFPPGTTMAYQPSRRVAVSPSRRIDVQFAAAPVILTRDASSTQSLLLADMADDAELMAFASESGRRLVVHLGPGLGVLEVHDANMEGAP